MQQQKFDDPELLRTQANQSTMPEISPTAAAGRDHRACTGAHVLDKSALYGGYQGDPISWWSWRPGIKPRNAVCVGGLITLLALLLGSIGLVTLVLGIMDNTSAPLQLPGIVASHTVNNLDGFPRLRITIYNRLHPVGFPAMVSPVVSQAAFHAIHDGDPILLDYSPRLHFLYALQSAGRYYMLPGVSRADNPIGSLALLLLAVTLLPYPALLTLWGLRDMLDTSDGREISIRAPLRSAEGPYRAAHGRSNGRCVMTARVVGKRAVLPTRMQRRDNRPGLTPRLSRSWYGLALDPVEPSGGTPSGACGALLNSFASAGGVGPRRMAGVMTFSVDDETYRCVDEGMLVQIVYSANLHYVYKLVGAGADVGLSVGASACLRPPPPFDG